MNAVKGAPMFAFSTPPGTVILVEGPRGLCSARLNAPSISPSEGPAPTPLLRDAHAWFMAYLRGDPARMDVPLDEVGTPFQLRCWAALRAIRPGETRTYAQQAAVLDPPGVARAVGAANAANPLLVFNPCHRVVGADGTLTGFAAGLPAKRWLLAHEARFFGRGTTLSLPGT